MTLGATEGEISTAAKPKPSALLFVLLIFAVVAIDQAAKHWARVELQDSGPRSYAGGTVVLTYAENTGAFLSMGAQLPRAVRRVIFDIMVNVGLIIGCYALFSRKIELPRDEIVCALVIGGGLGNTIDRLFRDGRVTDFIYLEAGPLHTGVFNVADMAVTGAVIFLLGTFLLDRDPSAAAAAE